MAALSGGLYLRGMMAKSSHAKETGFLAAEAMTNSIIVGEVIKLGAQRTRPDESDGHGRFFEGGSSFPSEHSMLAWSAASLIAHEYPGWLTEAGVYGLASAVSISRVAGQKHFPSDVLVGSTLGWLIGSQVYKAHHDTDLGGAQIGTFTHDAEDDLIPATIGTTYIPLDSWVYPIMDRLIAKGLIHSASVGLRPWTTQECIRLIDEAEASLDLVADRSGEEFEAITELKREFRDDRHLLGQKKPIFAGVDSIYSRYTGISGEPLRDSFHFGQTIINDNGRVYSEGSNIYSGVSGRFIFGRYSISVNGEFQHRPLVGAQSDVTLQTIAFIDQRPMQPARPANDLNQVTLLDSYVAANYGGTEISFGKQSLWWGPGNGGPLLFSNNAEPIYMFRINKTNPFQLPGFLRNFGLIRGEFFVGKLSGHTDPARPFLTGEKITFNLTRNLQLGFSATTVFSGDGRPGLTTKSLARAIFNVGAGSGNPDSNQPAVDPGDRRGGVDFSYRLPGLRNWITVYGDALADDDPSPLAAPRRAAFRSGFYLSRFPLLKHLDLRAENVYTDVPTDRSVSGNFIYRNQVYGDGYTNKGNLIGNWIGREGKGVQVWSTYHFSLKNSLQLGYRHSKVSKDFVPGGATLNDLSAETQWTFNATWSVSAALQYEQWYIPTIVSGRQSDTATTLRLNYHPRWKLSTGGKID